jgi:GMP synthase (glutamine-hydrolysing)
MPARVLVLDDTLYPRLFILGRRWASHFRGLDVDIVYVPSVRALPRVEGYTHLTLTGSEASMLRSPTWVAGEAELVRRAAASGVRVLGSRFGHQMLVRALPGPGYVERGVNTEVGWTPLEFVVVSELLRGIPNRWTLFSSHFGEVSGAPAPWPIFARSCDCATQIGYGDQPIWGIQAHSETSRRTAELATRAYLLLARHRGGVPRATPRRPPADDQVFFVLVGRFLGGEAGRSG